MRILILAIVCFVYCGQDLKERLKTIQQSQEQILRKEDVKQMPVIPEEAIKPEEEQIEQPQPRYYGDRLTRLEVTQQYMQKDLERYEKKIDEMNSVLTEVVLTLEKQSKVTEVQTDKTARVDIILNIVLGLVSFFITGGGGYFVWKNRSFVFRGKKLGDTQS